jgi:glycosyltransferase involved in cell wall biosynthesis
MVSVIVPNYNHSKFLKKRLDSILNQTYQDFEIIILDDCSTDCSKQIIEEYRANIKVAHIVYNEVNGGTTFRQWKKGLDLANGEFIWFAESDDFASLNFIEKLLPYLLSDKDVSIVFSDSNVINGNGEKIDNTKNWSPEIHGRTKIFGKSNTVLARASCFSEFCQYCIFPNTSAIISRKAVLLNKISFLDSRMKNSGDWKFWFHVALDTKVAYHDESLNYFRKHATNVTSSLLIMKLEALDILKGLLKLELTKNERNQVIKSLLSWSFNPAIWVNNISFNHSNIRYYFKKNISVNSLVNFIRYFVNHA